MKVRDLMSRRVLSVSPDDTIETARRFLHEHPIHHLPVVEKGRVIGILTFRHLTFSESTAKVSTVMARDFVVVDPMTTLRKAASLMLSGTTGCLPVMDGSNLAGIITASDLRRAVVDPEATFA